MAITVRFFADVADWIRGLGQSQEALGENEEALADVMRQAIELGDELGKTTDEIARDFSDAFGIPFDRAQRAVREVTEGTEEFKDAAKDAGRAAEDDLGDGVKDASSKAGDALGELGGIARDVLAGDFAGAAESAVSAIGGIAGAIAGGAIGGAIATAVGSIVGSWVSEWQEAAAESEERINTWADRFIEAQGRVLSEQTIMTEVNRILTDDSEKLAKARNIAASAGLSEAEAIRALAGDSELLSVATDSVSDALNLNARAQAGRRAQGKGVSDALIEERQELLKAQDALGKHSGELDSAAGKMDTYSEAMAIGKSRTEGLGDAVNELPETKEVKVRLTIDDQATAAADRIVKKIDGKVASITINTKYGSRTME